MKRISKIIVVLLIVNLLCISSFAFQNSEYDGVVKNQGDTPCRLQSDTVQPAKLSIENGSGMQGTTITLNVNIENNPGFAGLALSVDYDSEALELVNISKGSLLSDSDSGSITKNISKGQVLWTDYYDTCGDGTVFKLEFKLLPRSDYKKSEVSVSLKENNPKNFSNSVPEPIEAEFVSGTVEILAGEFVIDSFTKKGDSLDIIMNDSGTDPVCVAAAYYKSGKMVYVNCKSTVLMPGDNIFKTEFKGSYDLIKAFIFDSKTYCPLCESLQISA